MIFGGEWIKSFSHPPKAENPATYTLLSIIQVQYITMKYIHVSSYMHVEVCECEFSI